MHQYFALVYCGIYRDCALFQGRVTWRLVSDVRRAGGSRCASPACHANDIAGQGLHFDLPNAHVRSTAGPKFSSGDVAPDCARIENLTWKQAATG